MLECDVTETQSRDPMPHASAFPNMIWSAGGTFRIGSKHYPDEAPVYHVTVDGFRINCAGDQPRVSQFRQRHYITFVRPEGLSGCPGVDAQRRLAPIRFELLPPLSPGRAPCLADRHLDKPVGFGSPFRHYQCSVPRPRWRSFPLPECGKAHFQVGNANTASSYSGQPVPEKPIAIPMLARGSRSPR
jgi:hypothetical protein